MRETGKQKKKCSHIFKDEKKKKERKEMKERAYNRKEDKLLQEILGVISTEISKVSCGDKGETN